MKQDSRTRAISYGIALLLCGFGRGLSLSQSQPSAADRGRSVDIAVSTSGSVSFKRQGWKIFVPLAFGTTLQFGDLLKVGDAANLKIVCSDLTLHEVSNGVWGVPCPVESTPGSANVVTSGALLTPDGSLINPTRWSDHGSCPTVVWPGRGKLLSTLRKLRWMPVNGATDYSVTVQSEDSIWSTTVSGATETDYPANAPKLVPGVDYKMIVASGDHSSEAESCNGFGFSILGDSERKTVKEEVRRIQALGLPSGPTLFLTAYLYLSHGLESEAILKLEAALKSSKEPEIARVLGDCYRRAGLARQAKEAYLSSLAMEGAGADEEGQMLAHLRLGNDIYAQTLRDKEAAALHLNSALALARKMGDAVVAAQAEKALAELQ